MKRPCFPVRTFAVLAALCALGGAAVHAQVPATGVFVESESYVQPNGNSTLTSGPNIAGIGNGGAIVSTDPGDAFSGGAHIGFFDFYDWLEYNVNIPTDGVYQIQYYYASGWPANDTFPQDLVFWTSAQRITPPGAPTTANWGAYQLYTLADTVPLKAGSNRFRVRIRPDFGLVDTLGGSMNMDYIKFVRTGDYPNLVAVSGTVKATVNGTDTPIEGAYVFEDAGGAGLYAEAAHITRTDMNGHYTLYLSPGSHQITAFYNGYATASAQVTAPSSTDFSLSYNGKFEAEILDGTNPGRGNGDGVQAAYASGIYDPGTKAKIGEYSGNGLVEKNGEGTGGRFALYSHVVVPSNGAYDITMHYSNDQTPDVTLPEQWSVNGGGGPLMSLVGTGSFNTFQDSGPVLVGLKAGKNTLRWTNQDSTNFARVDYFTVAPTARPYGTLNVVVKDSSNKPVPGAKITVTGGGNTYSDAVNGAGNLSLPVPAGSYDVTASKTGSTTMVSVTVPGGGEVTANIGLALTAVVIEGENLSASGPEPSGSGVEVQPLDTASGGQILADLRGKGTPDAGSNYRYAEWTVNVAQAGWYKFGMSYSTAISPTDFAVTTDTTSARFDYPIPDTGGPGVYADFTTSNGEPIELPLVQGQNKIRLTMGNGAINLDYITLDRDTSKPATAFTTVTGTVSGTDGTGAAPIRGAVLFSSWFTNSPEGSFYTATTNATGHYTLNVPQDGVNGDGSSPVAALAPGYITSPVATANGGGTQNLAVQLNNTPGTNPPSLELDFSDRPTIIAQVLAVGSGRIATTVGELAYVDAGPDTWIDLNVNAPRSGLYDLTLNYSNGSLDTGASASLPVTVGGVTVVGTFQGTTAWNNYVTVSPFVTIPLQSGPNTVRLSFPDAAANIMYLDFKRAGDLPPMASTDIDGNGVTNALDAVVYARRLAGTDTGATPDVNGDTHSNAADVQRILSVAGGLM